MKKLDTKGINGFYNYANAHGIPKRTTAYILKLLKEYTVDEINVNGKFIIPGLCTFEKINYKSNLFKQTYKALKIRPARLFLNKLSKGYLLLKK